MRYSLAAVAAPEPAALREAAYFVDRLSEEGMPLAGVVVALLIPVFTPQRQRVEGAVEVIRGADLCRSHWSGRFVCG